MTVVTVNIVHYKYRHNRHDRHGKGKRGDFMGEIRISKTLFNALCQYHLRNDKSRTVFIKAELEDKMNRHTRRIIYTQAKTGDTEEARENAFSVYQNLQKR